MRRFLNISLLSFFFMILGCVALRAADSNPTIRIGFSAPLGTTVEIKKPVALTKYTFAETTSHLFELKNYTFGGGAYFQMGVYVPVGGKTLQVFYNNKSYMTKSLEYGANLVDFFIPLTSYKSFMFYVTIK